MYCLQSTGRPTRGSRVEIAGRGSSGMARPSDGDYRRLLEFRAGIRQFLRWSQRAAEAEGLNPAVHQLMLAIRGSGEEAGPTIADAAAWLVVQHNTAVGIVDRAERAGLVERSRDPADRRIVRLQLAPEGIARLDRLTAQHLEELRRMGPALAVLWQDLPSPGTAGRSADNAG